MVKRSLALLVACLTFVPAASPAAAACATTWQPTADPGGGYATDVSVIDVNSAWYVADASAFRGYVARYDGTTWEPQPFPQPGLSERIRAVAALADDDVWIAGDQVSLREESIAYLAHWDGDAFTYVPVDEGDTASTFFDVDILTKDDAWVIGWIHVGRHFRSLAMHWDGTTWTVVKTPRPPHQEHTLYAVTMIASDDVWAVGSRTRAGRTKPLTLHWDGTAWTRHFLPEVGTRNTGLFGVDGTATDSVWAVGQVANGGRTLAVRWDGEAWNVVPTPNPDPSVNSLQDVMAVRASLAWAVGYKDDGEPLLIRWDGTEWAEAPGAGGPGRTLAAIDEGVDGSAMIAGTLVDGGGFVLQRCPAA